MGLWVTAKKFLVFSPWSLNSTLGPAFGSLKMALSLQSLYKSVALEFVEVGRRFPSAEAGTRPAADFHLTAGWGSSSAAASQGQVWWQNVVSSRKVTGLVVGGNQDPVHPAHTVLAGSSLSRLGVDSLAGRRYQSLVLLAKLVDWWLVGSCWLQVERKRVYRLNLARSLASRLAW